MEDIDEIQSGDTLIVQGISLNEKVEESTEKIQKGEFIYSYF